MNSRREPSKSGTNCRSSLWEVEDVPLHIAVESVSAPPPVYGEPIRRPAFEGYSSSSISVVVQDEDGPLTPQLDSSGAETFGGPLLCPPPYPQGTPVQVERSLRQLGLLPTKPGNYKISVTSLHHALLQLRSRSPS